MQNMFFCEWDMWAVSRPESESMSGVWVSVDVVALMILYPESFFPSASDRVAFKNRSSNPSLHPLPPGLGHVRPTGESIKPTGGCCHPQCCLQQHKTDFPKQNVINLCCEMFELCCFRNEKVFFFILHIVWEIPCVGFRGMLEVFSQKSKHFSFFKGNL